MGDCAIDGVNLRGGELKVVLCSESCAGPPIRPVNAIGTPRMQLEDPTRTSVRPALVDPQVGPITGEADGHMSRAKPEINWSLNAEIRPVAFSLVKVNDHRTTTTH